MKRTEVLQEIRKMRYEEEGIEGLYDRRLGKATQNANPIDEILELTTLYESRYSDFSVSHFYDKYHLLC